MAALEEDIGAGDITTQTVVPAGLRTRAELLAKEHGVLAGVAVARRVFELLDSEVEFTAMLEDGAQLTPGIVVANILGEARTILGGERTALNFVQRLSGIASAVAQAVRKLSNTRTRLLDTRKTTPGLRALEKGAVRAGGGFNHRLGLFDAILIKNNHLKFTPPAQAIRLARAAAPVTACIEIEVEDFEQLREALQAGPDIIMLDNMGIEKVREAIDIINGRARIEVSGNVRLDTVAELAALGVDYISVGALTHSSPSLDLALRVTGV